MVVRRLWLQNFRNYAFLDLQPARGLNVFFGPNGVGKTNLLEALSVLATTRSPLCERDREWVRWQQATCGLKTIVYHEVTNATTTLELSVIGAEKTLKVDDARRSDLQQWLGTLQVVAFFPHDLSIVAGDPGERRRFLNVELSKAQPTYFHDWTQYRRALQQRNALLKMRQRTSLGEWDAQLAHYGCRLMVKRRQFLMELAPLVRDTHAALSGTDVPLSVTYAPSLPCARSDEVLDLEEKFLQTLRKNFEEDARRGITHVGPHRDDLAFRLGDMDLRRYGSQGQQRLAMLGLKIALARWVERTTGESPLLLLDDALSELDASRRRCLLRQAQSFPQAMLTSADRHLCDGVDATFFEVRDGQVQQA
ncbi:MAG: DNA replication/repair protein RecF [Abditibacteriales bacterium]|nr:DNA replication/repair protein RecF [Abditibacteriales bacterium]MDW8367938.1 DNA replication/repair protein RecF [Abditibacteriales bacterium]